MTTQERITALKADSRTTITPKEAAEIIGCDPYYLNMKAKQDRLPFAFMFSGNRLHIVKNSLFAWLGV